jgi:hypothetical protein
MMRISIKKSSALFVAVTVILLASCSGSKKQAVDKRDEAFERDCAANAVVRIRNPVLWQRYKKLAVEHSARIDGKPTLVEREGFTFRFGKERSAMRANFSLGIHDDEISVLFHSTEVAVLSDRIKITNTFASHSGATCIDNGLGRYF